jgi:DNA-binding MarR family transcriptional regulator
VYFDIRRILMARPSKQVRELVGELGRAMQAYQRSTQAYDDTVGRRLGLNPADLRCLDWLVDGAKSAGELSAAVGLKPAATTTLIDRLTAKGYVRRVASPEDRRKVLVEMTEEGMARTYEMYRPMVEEGQAQLLRLDVDELTRMRDYLVGIRELTDRHRERLAAETGVPGEQEPR